MGAQQPSPAVSAGSVPGNPTNLGPTPWPAAAQPSQEPWAVIPVPEHVSTGLWQQSYYDPTSSEDAAVYTKRPSGPCDLETGKLLDTGFHPGHHWRQV